MVVNCLLNLRRSSHVKLFLSFIICILGASLEHTTGANSLRMVTVIFKNTFISFSRAARYFFVVKYHFQSRSRHSLLALYRLLRIKFRKLGYIFGSPPHPQAWSLCYRSSLWTWWCGRTSTATSARGHFMTPRSTTGHVSSPTGTLGKSQPPISPQYRLYLRWKN